MYQKIKTLINPFILLVLSLFICLCSPLHPFANNIPSTDSSVFLLIGKLMSQGIMPYRDIFDHKGPLLYVINWAGMLIGYEGVWFIECICILLSVLLCYTTARRFFNQLASLLGTITTFISLLSWFQGGNLTESYALPLFFGAIYCFTGYFAHCFELSNIQIFVIGLSVGGILMLRPNMIGLWVGMFTVIITHTLLIHKYRKIFIYFIYYILGIIISFLPFIIWLKTVNSLYDFYRCYFQFNINYINVPKITVIKSIINAFNYPITPIMFVCLLILASCIKNRNRNNHKFVLIISLIVTLFTTILLSSISGYTFPHYYMTYLPCIIIPITWLIQEVLSHLRIKPFVIFLIICILLNQSLLTGQKLLKNAMDKNYYAINLSSLIKQITNADEQILYIGNFCNIYLLSNRKPACYYPYYSSNFMKHPSYINSYIKEIEYVKPKLILYDNIDLPEIIEKIIKDNYSIIHIYEKTTICTLNILNEKHGSYN